MDPRIEFYKAAFSQKCNGFDFSVFRETSRYQYGQGLGDLIRGIVRYIPSDTEFLKPDVMTGIQTYLKAGSKASKEGAMVKDVIKCTLKPTVGADIGAKVDQVASKLIELRNNQNDAPSPNSPIMLPELNQAGSGKTRRSQTVYKKKPKRSKYSLTSGQLFIIFKMATIGGDVTVQITSEVDLFGSIMQQNVIDNEFNREYAPLATIQ